MDANQQNPLNQPASSSIIQDLYTTGYLDDKAREEAFKLLCPPKIMWQRWADRMLLLFSSALILAGIVFFFAFNWAAMAAWLKLGLIETALLGCVVAALVKGVEQLTGKIFLLAASVFIGVLLAVYGQIYQTGADAYQLFVGWALLITGWVIVAKFGGLWLMWGILINTSIILYSEQTQNDNPEKLCTILALVNLLFLIAREYGFHKNLSWLSGKWLRWILLGWLLFFLTSFVFMLIVDGFKQDPIAWAIAPLFILLSLLAVTYYFCRYQSKDLFSLTMGALSVCTVVLTLIGKVLFKASDNFLAIMLFALIVLGVVSIAAFVLLQIGKQMEKEVGYGN